MEGERGKVIARSSIKVAKDSRRLSPWNVSGFFRCVYFLLITLFFLPSSEENQIRSH